MKRLICLFCALVILLCSLSVRAEDGVAVSARAYALYCVNNGEFLLSGNADERLPMASTTKVMTALLTLEAAEKDNRSVTFTEEMITEGSSMYLQVGEKLTLRDLAVGMLLCSGNDAANCAAISLSGSVEAFAEQMNRRAKSLELKDTHFVTPSGLDDEEHYSTARDMAILTAAAMENPEFARIAGSKTMRVDFTEPNDKSVSYQNHNRLLSMYEGCIGGKTGYTSAAGRCLVSCAERNGLRLVCVTLGDPDDWDDHMALFDYGFALCFAAEIPDDCGDIPVVGGERDTVSLYADVPYAPVESSEDAEIHTVSILPAFLFAPVKKGEQAGTLRVMCGGECLAEYPIRVGKSVKYKK